MRWTEQLAAEHSRILEALQDLDGVLREVGRTRAVPSEFLRALLAFSQSFVDRCHHAKEEGCLFPCLERLGLPRDGGPIGIMLQEHEEGRALVRKIAAALDLHDAGRAEAEDVLAPCREYAELLRQHIDKENAILFPMGEAVMGDDDDDATVACFADTDAPAGEAACAHLAQSADRLPARRT